MYQWSRVIGVMCQRVMYQCIMFLVGYVMIDVSCFRFHVSYVNCHVSCATSNVMIPKLRIMCHIPRVMGCCLIYFSVM
jgi:hypothetical protein